MAAEVNLYSILLWSLYALSIGSMRPNIIFMFGDDIGFNEFGFNGCTDTISPVIDELVRSESLLLWNNYVAKVCSPSRAAFLSGRYPSSLGLQNLVFNQEFPVSLTRQVSTLSDEFKAAGYSTHMIGKWHLGMQSWEYTPTYRGFDTFAGYYGGWQTYFTHQQFLRSPDKGDVPYYDLRINEEECIDAVEQEIYGVFWERDQALNLLRDLKDADDPFFLYIGWQASHTPDEAPPEYLAMYSELQSGDVKSDSTSTEQIEPPPPKFDEEGNALTPPDRTFIEPDWRRSRRFNQAQTTTLDESIGAVVEYLKTNDMWDNTLLVFSSDNGGDYNRGDNYPLRGYKNSSFEGGVRVPGFVSGGYLAEERRGKVLREAIVHVTDWYQTLLAAAGIEIGYHRSNQFKDDEASKVQFGDDVRSLDRVPLDGHNLWPAIQLGEVDETVSAESRELLLDLNPKWCQFSSCGTIRVGPWKFIRGVNMASNAQGEDGDLWQNLMATCSASENIVHCDGDGVTDPDTLQCHHEESGCLFNVELDPCERSNVGQENPEIRMALIERLDHFERHSVSPLVTMDDRLQWDEYDPIKQSNTNFWSPFQHFSAVQFEHTLRDRFEELYLDKEKHENELFVALKFEHSDVDRVLSVVMGILLLISIGSVIWVNRKYTARLQFNRPSKLRRETEPLVS